MGASANEGKTTISCQLAASLARTGKRVALIDCDLRRPSAHLMVGGKQGPGICELLRGDATMDDIRQQTQAPGLTFIGADSDFQRQTYGYQQEVVPMTNIEAVRRS